MMLHYCHNSSQEHKTQYNLIQPELDNPILLLDMIIHIFFVSGSSGYILINFLFQWAGGWKCPDQLVSRWQHCHPSTACWDWTHCKYFFNFTNNARIDVGQKMLDIVFTKVLVNMYFVWLKSKTFQCISVKNQRSSGMISKIFV